MEIIGVSLFASPMTISSMFFLLLLCIELGNIEEKLVTHDIHAENNSPKDRVHDRNLKRAYEIICLDQTYSLLFHFYVLTCQRL